MYVYKSVAEYKVFRWRHKAALWSREGRPLFHRVSRCVHDSGMGWRVYPPQPLETNVAAFVGEVERCDEKRFETAL